MISNLKRKAKHGALGTPESSSAPASKRVSSRDLIQSCNLSIFSWFLIMNRSFSDQLAFWADLLGIGDPPTQTRIRLAFCADLLRIRRASPAFASGDLVCRRERQTCNRTSSSFHMKFLIISIFNHLDYQTKPGPRAKTHRTPAG